MRWVKGWMRFVFTLTFTRFGQFRKAWFQFLIAIYFNLSIQIWILKKHFFYFLNNFSTLLFKFFNLGLSCVLIFVNNLRGVFIFIWITHYHYTQFSFWILVPKRCKFIMIIFILNNCSVNFFIKLGILWKLG